MFDKLKKKFILMNMVLLTTVFIGIFGTIYVMTAFSLNRDMEMQLRNSMNPMAKPPKGNMDVTITINLDSENKITNIVSRFDVSEWNTKQVIDEILSNNESLSKIKINGESYAYLKQNINGGIKIVLISRAYQQDVLGNLLRIFILVGAISLIVLFLISIYFTNRTIEPLEESFKKQKQFIADASHELRTPISVIQGYANMLDRWGKSDESVLDESIAAIKSESENMKNLVEQLLFLARGINGKTQLTITEFSLNNMMSEVLEESKMIDDKHIYSYINSEEINVYGDIGLLKQTARILVENAAKYTEAGEDIILRIGKNDKNEVYFSVQDNGIGMDAEDVPHIFERFFRADTARVRKNGGTGLGLSIAKWIIDNHKDYFSVLSRKGIGTRITVYLPEN